MPTLAAKASPSETTDSVHSPATFGWLFGGLSANTSAALQLVRATAEQFTSAGPLAVLVRYVSDKIAPTHGPFRPPYALSSTVSLPDLGSTLFTEVQCQRQPLCDGRQICIKEAADPVAFPRVHFVQKTVRLAHGCERIKAVFQHLLKY